MLTFMLHITVKEDCEVEAMKTLSTIEDGSHTDQGCANFIWLQHEQEPRRFTLFEQWESQEDLNAHLKKDPSPWEHFVSCLAIDPQSESFRSVKMPARPLKEEDARDFVAIWFDRMSRHVAVAELLPMLAEDDLEMVFPDATLKNKTGFTKWYAEVGQLFEDQTHDLEKLKWLPASDSGNIQLSVVWKARNKKNGSRIISRAQQAWTLKRSLLTDEPVIVKYQVLSLDDVR